MGAAMFGYNKACSDECNPPPWCDAEQNAAAAGTALLYTTCVPWTICGVLYSTLHFLYPRDMERIFEQRRLKEVAGVGLSCERQKISSFHGHIGRTWFAMDRPLPQRCARHAACIAQASAAEMWLQPFDTTLRLKELALQRCGACHSACMDSAGQGCRDAVPGANVRVYRPDLSQATRRDE